MIKQHAHRLGTEQSAQKVLSWITGPHCVVPKWLLEADAGEPGSTDLTAVPHTAGTKEPKEALKFIYRFNPLQGYLTEGASTCGGWGDWCCVCHAAQRRIACLDEGERGHVDWFLTEDCCESKMARNRSSAGFVENAVPARNTTL